MMWQHKSSETGKCLSLTLSFSFSFQHNLNLTRPLRKMFQQATLNWLQYLINPTPKWELFNISEEPNLCYIYPFVPGSCGSVRWGTPLYSSKKENTYDHLWECRLQFLVCFTIFGKAGIQLSHPQQNKTLFQWRVKIALSETLTHGQICRHPPHPLPLHLNSMQYWGGYLDVLVFVRL